MEILQEIIAARQACIIYSISIRFYFHQKKLKKKDLTRFRVPEIKRLPSQQIIEILKSIEIIVLLVQQVSLGDTGRVL